MLEATKKIIHFGFNSSEFEVAEEIIPYAQFLNPVGSYNWGIGIKMSCAKAAQFQPDSN